MKKLLLIFITLHLFTAKAVADLDLYSGEVIVSSQSSADRQQAIPEALIRVLQKLSGRREMPVSPALDEALENAERLLVSFRYQNVERTSADGEVTRQLWLVAQFRASEVDAVVQKAGLPRWQRERPAIQIWAVMDDGFSRQLQPVEYDYAWETMERVAEMRGLPVTWPVLDDEQIQLIDMSLLWGGFTDYLVERGAPEDGVAIVAVRREGPLWSLRWHLADGEQQWSWRNNDQELMYALTEGIHFMSDQIASSHAIAASEQDYWSMELGVTGLNGSNDYVNCLNYLQNQSLVTSVDVLGAEPGRVNFRLHLNASPEDVAEAFNRGSVLLPTGQVDDNVYRYAQ